PAMDRLDQEGVVNPESRVPLAKTGVGVAVRAGAPPPHPSTPGTFKQGAPGGEAPGSRPPEPPQSKRGKGGAQPRPGRNFRRAQAADQGRSNAGGEPGIDRQGRGGDGAI